MIQYHACRCSLGRPGRDYRADGSRIELKQAITASLLVRNFRMAALNSPPPDHKRSWSGTPNSVLPRRKLISPTCRSAPRASNRSPRSSQCASSVVSTAASFSAAPSALPNRRLSLHDRPSGLPAPCLPDTLTERLHMTGRRPANPYNADTCHRAPGRPHHGQEVRVAPVMARRAPSPSPRAIPALLSFPSPTPMRIAVRATCSARPLAPTPMASPIPTSSAPCASSRSTPNSTLRSSLP